jgi:hypothetical protein
MRQLLTTLCVASSLILVTLGGSDPPSGFHLQTLGFSKPPPPSHRGACWGYDFCIPYCRSGHNVQGVGEAGKLSLPNPLLHSRGPNRLTTDNVWFKASSHPCTPLYPFAPSVVLSLPPSLCLKKERGTERGESQKEGKQE